jgi:outer membrane protein TolC
MKRTIESVSFVLTLAAVLATVPAVAEEATAPAPSAPAEERIAAAMELAASSAPRAEAERARLAAELAGARAEAAPGGATLEGQGEGFGDSLDREGNAVDTVRLAKPFRAPWQRRAARRFTDEAGRWLGSAALAQLLARAGDAGRRWLALAAELDRLELARRRLGRLERALEIQRKRLELGEVSGSEVTQLELQRLQDAAAVRAAELRRHTLAEELRSLAGGDFPPPRAGDLLSLAGGLGEVPGTSPELADAPGVTAAEGRASSSSAWESVARQTAWGLPEAEVEWERVPTIDGSPSFDAFGVRLTVPLPFGRQGRERIAEAELAASAAHAEARQARLDAAATVRALGRAAGTAAATLDDLSPSLEAMPRTERSLTEQFRLGAVSYLVLIDGLTRLDEVRSRAIDAREELLAARLALAVTLADDRYFPIPKIPVPDLAEEASP